MEEPELPPGGTHPRFATELQACDPLASRRTLRERRRTPRPPAGAEISGRDRHRASGCMRWPDPVAVPTRHPAVGSAGRLVGPAESLAINRLLDNCHGCAETPSRAARRPAPRCRRRQRPLDVYLGRAERDGRRGCGPQSGSGPPAHGAPGPALARSSVMRRSLRHGSVP